MQDNARELVTAVVQPHEEALKKLTYSPVFAGLLVRYEQMNYVEAKEPEPVMLAQFALSDSNDRAEHIAERSASVAMEPWSAIGIL